MVVESTRASIEYKGNGTANEFSFPETVFDLTHLKVFVDGEETDNFVAERVPDTQRAMIIYPADGDPLPLGSNILIRRRLPLKQPTNFQTQGGILPETIERQLDRMTLMIQQLAENVSAPNAPGRDATGQEAVYTVYNSETLPAERWPNNDWDTDGMAFQAIKSGQ